MTVSVFTVKPGSASVEWVVEIIHSFKKEDLLAPVTVIVPNHYTGLFLKRHFAKDGYANVRFVQVDELIDEIGLGELQHNGWNPLNSIIQTTLFRLAVQSSGQSLGPIAKKRGMLDLFSRLVKELRQRADMEDLLESFSKSENPTTRFTTVVIRDFEKKRIEAKLFDMVDQFKEVTRSLQNGEKDKRLKEIGPVVFFLPEYFSIIEAEFVRVLAKCIPVTLGLADFGPTFVDPISKHFPDINSKPVPTVCSSPRMQVLLATDPVEEVREVVRSVLAALGKEKPVPLYQQAIIYQDNLTYESILRETLVEANIPYVFLEGRPLEDSTVSQSLLGLLRLREKEFSRNAVLIWLSGLPDRGGTLAENGRWAQLSRECFVSQGVSQWVERLTYYINEKEKLLNSHREKAKGDYRDKIYQDVVDAQEIITKITTLEKETRLPEESTWEAYSKWALHLLHNFVVSDFEKNESFLGEINAVDQVLLKLQESGLFEPIVSFSEFFEALQMELQQTRPEGKVGQGIIIGPSRLLVGSAMDRVMVVGSLESAYPLAMPVDPLISGDPLERRELFDYLRRRDWLTALACADKGEVLVSCPLTDIEGRKVFPSPWLLELLAGFEGSPSASDICSGKFVDPRLKRVVAPVPLGETTILTLAEHREVEALAAYRENKNLFYIPLANREDLGFACVLAVNRKRKSSELSMFDGNLSSSVELELLKDGLSQGLYSASSLQNWALCPFKFFLGQLLRVEETKEKDDRYWWTIAANERGLLIHRILEEYFQTVVDSGKPESGGNFSPDDLSQFEKIAEFAFREWEVKGVVGHPLAWTVEKERILRLVNSLLKFDAVQRCLGDWKPLYLEKAFGRKYDKWPPVFIFLKDGRKVKIKGFIDRVDINNQGLIRVIDYKTGNQPKITASLDNLFDSGRQLQLPIYGRAVSLALNKEGSAFYWYISEGDFKQSVLLLSESLNEVLTSVITKIDSGVRAGCFPQVPGEDFGTAFGYENCRICPYDSLCPASRDIVSAAKSASPVLDFYKALQPVVDKEEK